MSEETTKTQPTLPPSIISTVDLGNIARELETVDGFFAQAEARNAGESLTPPKTSRTLENLAKDYNLNLLDEKDRAKLAKFLEDLRTNAPVIHISFAAEPSAAFLKKIIEWFRLNIHPQVLVRVGLQPSMAAGCIVRTPNKYFDFSMRRHFNDHLDKLAAGIHGGPAK
jgi:F0F1-type ATP synthase delta subunit